MLADSFRKSCLRFDFHISVQPLYSEAKFRWKPVKLWGRGPKGTIPARQVPDNEREQD